MLIALLRKFLLPYRRLLLIVLGLTVVQVMATLFLPTINADIIDKGVIPGNTDYIWRMGGVMLLVTFVQVGFAIAAVYFGARAAMAFGRDVRSALFHRVTDYSAQDVAGFGAPSLSRSSCCSPARCSSRRRSRSSAACSWRCGWTARCRCCCW
jgi:ATP-binding cassette subfamily B multidrug efflux pump